jgi:hypothetical protein
LTSPQISEKTSKRPVFSIFGLNLPPRLPTIPRSRRGVPAQISRIDSKKRCLTL